MFRKKRRAGELIPSDKIDTIIGKGTQFTGDITTAGILQIQGNMEGNITSSSDVIVTESSTIKGDITGINMVITGTQIGNTDLQGRLEIGSSGKVSGDIHVCSLVIEEGGILEGRCEMRTKAQSKLFHKQKETQPVSNPT